MVRFALMLAAVLGLASEASASPDTWLPGRRAPTRVLPAEFETQEGVLIGWDRDDAGMQHAISDIVAAAWDRINFYILVPCASAEADAARQLRLRGVPRRAVRFLHVPTDSVWTRDYGPIVVLTSDGRTNMIDSDYGHGDRVGDDLVPAALAPTFGMNTLRPPITADGGNIQTNGRGLAITTTSLVEHNAERGYTEEHVARLLRDYYGLDELVFLEPLAGEQTGHVDMFAVFVAHDTVLVGRYDPRHDPVNAAILDRNAERLAMMQTRHGPLRVVRIPMPPRDEKTWRTYTNVLFANGTLVVPQYGEIDPHGHAIAMAIYRRLMPGWVVRSIDCDPLIAWGGAIHCVTMNLCRVQGAELNPSGLFDDPPPFEAPPQRRERSDPGLSGRRRPFRARPSRPDAFTSPAKTPWSNSNPLRGDDDAEWRSVDSTATRLDEPEWYPHRRPDEARDVSADSQWNAPVEPDEELWRNPRPSALDRSADASDDTGLTQWRASVARPARHVLRSPRRLMFTDDTTPRNAEFEPFPERAAMGR